MSPFHLLVRRLSLILWIGLLALLIVPAALAKNGDQPEFIDTVNVQFSVDVHGANGNGPESNGPPGWNSGGVDGTPGSFGRDNAQQQAYENAIRQAQHDILKVLPNDSYEVVVQPEDEPLLVLNVTSEALTTLEAMPDVIIEGVSGIFWFVNDNSPCSGAACTGTSWATAFKDLQQGLAAAAAGDDIWVAAGVYYPDVNGATNSDNRSDTFTINAGEGVYGGFAGTETALRQRNIAANVTILSGDITQNDTDPDADFIIEDPAHMAADSNSYHVVTGGATSGSGVVDGLTITGGQATHISAGADQIGGGFRAATQQPTLNNISFIGNTARTAGGALSSNAANARRLSNILVMHNGSLQNTPGLSFNPGGAVTLTNGQFYGNVSSDPSGLGGAITVFGSAAHVVSNVVVVGSVAQGGGSCLRATNSAAVTIRNMTCTFSISTALLTDLGGSISAVNTIVRNTGGVSSGSVTFTNSNTTTDPLFVSNPSAGDSTFATLSDNNYGDVRLQSTSPSIDQGTNTGLTTSQDVIQQARVVDGDAVPGAVTDEGAYEYQLAVPHTITYNPALRQSFSCDPTGTTYTCYFGVNLAGLENGRQYTFTQLVLPVTGSSDNWQATTAGPIRQAVQFNTTYTGTTGATVPFFVVLYQKSDMGTSTTFDLTARVYVEVTFTDRVTSECTRSYFIYDKTTQTVEVAGNRTQFDFNNQNRALCTVGFGPTLGETYLP